MSRLARKDGSESELFLLVYLLSHVLNLPAASGIFK
jgi:hypothetical protein